MHVTIEETDEGTLICLHLLPSETLPEPLISGQPPRRLFPPGQSGPLRLGPSGSRTGRLAPPTELASALGPRSLPSVDSLLKGLQRSLAKRPRGNLSKAIQIGSRTLAALLGLEEGSTISANVAFARGESVAQVHVRMAASLLGIPGVADDLIGAVSGDLERLAVEGDAPELGRIGELIEAQLEIAQDPSLPLRPGFTILNRNKIVENLQRLARVTELNRTKALRIQEE